MLSQKEVKEALNNREFEVVYFSTHGKGGFDIPINSHLVLKGGVLTVADLLEVDFKADLVVLSACEVNQTFSKGIDDAAELERAFLVSGARNVIASKVKVPATHTLEFLPCLVEGFLKKKRERKNRPVARAFQEACLKACQENLPVWESFRLAGLG